MSAYHVKNELLVLKQSQERQKKAAQAAFLFLGKTHTIKGTINKATKLMILISGFTAGPAVSL